MGNPPSHLPCCSSSPRSAGMPRRLRGRRARQNRIAAPSHLPALPSSSPRPITITATMGAGLQKQFFAFEALIDPGQAGRIQTPNQFVGRRVRRSRQALGTAPAESRSRLYHVGQACARFDQRPCSSHLSRARDLRRNHALFSPRGLAAGGVDLSRLSPPRFPRFFHELP